MNLSTQTTNTLVTNKFAKGQNILIPIAHGEGRDYADTETLKILNEMIRYCFAIVMKTVTLPMKQIRTER